MPTHTSVAVHTISFRGTAGSIFVSLVIGAICYVIGFATPNWTATSRYNEGLWETCRCGDNGRDDDWFIATKAMIIIGLVGLAVALLLICLYMCVHQVSKNSTIIGLVVVCFLSVVFMLVGIIIYGAKLPDNLNWSYALTIIGCIFTFIAGILSFVQLRSSGVHI